MPRVVEFGGQHHEFPDSFTDEQVSEALNGHHEEQKGFFRSLYDQTVQPAVDTVKAIAQRGGPAVLNDAIQSTFDKLHQYAGTEKPNIHDYLQAVPLVGGTADTALTQAQAGNYAGAAGTTAGLAAQILGPKLLKEAPGMVRAAAPAAQRVMDAIPEAAAIGKDAMSGAWDGAMSGTPNHFGLKVPAVVAGAGAGAIAARTVGAPGWAGGIVGGSIPVIKGATQAIKRGMGARATADAIAASRAAGPTPVWEGMPTAASVVPEAIQPTPGQFPSGRIPGPAPIPEQPVIAARPPLWQGIANSPAQTPQVMTSTPGALPSGRIPGRMPAPQAPAAPQAVMPETVPAPAVSASRLYPDHYRAGKPGGYAHAPDTVDGLMVRDKVPNMGSIESTLDNAEVLPGIRKIPLSEFENHNNFYSADDQARVDGLAKQIQESGEINPLITVMDSKGPYILEGGHRLAALSKLGKKYLPSKVVIDRSEVPQGSEHTFFPSEAATPQAPAAPQAVMPETPAAPSPIPAAYAGEASGLQIPQVVNSRAGVAKGIAAHLHAAGITASDLDALEANPDAWKLFWNNTGRIPGVSKQAHYAPSTSTIDAARDALSGIEKTKTVTPPKPKPVVPGPLVGNAKALSLAQQLAAELGQIQ